MIVRYDGKLVMVVARRCECGAEYEDFRTASQVYTAPCLVCGRIEKWEREQGPEQETLGGSLWNPSSTGTGRFSR